MLAPEIKKLLEEVSDRQALLAYLRNHMTERRSQRFEEVLEFRTRYITVAVEDVYQERNASAIVRTADCFGVQDVHIIENYNEYKLSPAIARGSEKWVDVHVYDHFENNSLACIDSLRDKGYKIIASTPHQKGKTINTLNLKEPLAVFLGGEKEGLSRTVLDLADDHVNIPMFGFTESFNISVAGALILQELTKRLRESSHAWALSERERMDLRLEWTIKTVAGSKELIQKYLTLQQ